LALAEAAFDEAVDQLKHLGRSMRALSVQSDLLAAEDYYVGEE
jgi:hypothetical protein